MTIQIKNADTIKTDFIKFLRSAIEENGGPNVTDYNIGSVLNVLVEAFSDVLENYYYDLFQITRDSLENIYNGFNFFKIPGKKALVSVTIYVDAPAISSLNVNYFSIPRGTKVSTDDGSVLFEIADDYSTDSMIISSSGEFSGKIEYNVQAICTESGISGNINANEITKFSSSITNVNNYSYWIRNSSASGGTDAESEADMKIRFQKYLISLRRGTKESLEYALATNAAFTGLMYSISGFRFLNIIKQTSYSIGTNNYDQDLTYLNKFYPSYSLFTDSDAAGTDPFYLYIGADDKFNNLILSTQSVPSQGDAGSYLIIGISNPLYTAVAGGIEYFDTATQSWEQAEVLNIDLSIDYPIIADQYLAWQIDTTRWGKSQIRDYTAYFIRINMRKSGDNRPNFDVYKAMTYPFPGYIDIYCLKNYRDSITTDDKTLISESIDNYKAAGVITTVSNASVVQIHPTIIIQTSDLTNSLVPSDIVESIRADVIAFSNSKNIGVDFIRNELYAYLYQRYNQYGNLYIYYRYDPSIYEDLANNVFKEGFRDSILDASVSEKIDLLLSDIYVVRNLNSLVNTLTGYKYVDVPASGLYNDYYYKDVSSLVPYVPPPALNWSGLAASPKTGSVYACAPDQDIYMRLGGFGNFSALGTTMRTWGEMAAHQNGNVYVLYNGNYYMQTNGSGSFNPADSYSAFGSPYIAKSLTGITISPSTGDVYICDYGFDPYAAGGGIYKQTDGSGIFNKLTSVTLRHWGCMAAAPNGNIYAAETNGDIYMLSSAGTGDFAALSQTSRVWVGMTAAPNGNIYACEYGGDIYMQTGGSGNFIALGQASRVWSALAAAPNGDVYAAEQYGDQSIYIQTFGVGDFVLLSQTPVWAGLDSAY